MRQLPHQQLLRPNAVIVFQTNGAPNASRQLGSLRCRLGKLRLFSMSRTPCTRED